VPKWWLWLSTFSLALSSITQRRSRQQHWYCVGVNMPKRYRQLRVTNLPKVSTRRLEWDSNLQPSEPTTEPPRPTIRCYNNPITHYVTQTLIDNPFKSSVSAVPNISYLKSVKFEDQQW